MSKEVDQFRSYSTFILKRSGCTYVKYKYQKDKLYLITIGLPHKEVEKILYKNFELNDDQIWLTSGSYPTLKFTFRIKI